MAKNQTDEIKTWHDNFIITALKVKSTQHKNVI